MLFVFVAAVLPLIVIVAMLPLASCVHARVWTLVIGTTADYTVNKAYTLLYTI